MKPILEIKNISKKFRINRSAKRYHSLRDSISGMFSSDIGGKEDFYALKNISFNVERGDTIGIVGKNGAGKSTLLKILSKITPPTSGSILCRGRLASLLEVGTGFHPELTGRENIFFNGSILGMKRKEIEKNFDAIVDFSGVEKFLDTPLKHYSSGMQLRLAFAVAAFLENEILVIDEVLAVGDAEFQRKCLGKMEDVSRSGRTILFVSHNMAAVAQLCKKAVLIRNGELAAMDNSSAIISEYLRTEVGTDSIVYFNEKKRDFYFEYIEITNERSERTGSFSMGEQVNVSFKYRNFVPHKTIQICLVLRTIEGVPIAYITNEDSKFDVNKLKNDEYSISVSFHNILLYPNTYIISLIADELNGLPLSSHQDCISFKIDNGGDVTYRALPKHSGTYFLTPEWKIIQ